MHTKTMEEILGPVAEAIAQFVLLNEESEQGNFVLPDLTPVATLVVAQVQNLVKVGRSLLAEESTKWDAAFQRNMPDALDELNAFAVGLMESCRSLANNPSDTPARKKMSHNTKGILTGTTAVLDVFDDHEVAKLERYCLDAKEKNNLLRIIDTVEQLVQVIKPACQAFINTAQATEVRVAELINPALQQRLRDAADNLKQTSTLMVSSCKTAVSMPDSQSSRKVRDICSDRMGNILDEILQVIKIRQLPLRDLNGMIAKARAEAAEQLLALSEALLAGDVAGADAASAGFVKAIDKLVASARQVANTVSSPASRDNVLAAIRRMEDAKDKLVQAHKHAKANPNDPAAAKALNTAMANASNEVDNLERAVDAAIGTELDSAAAELSRAWDSGATALARMVDAALTGNVPETERRIRDFDKEYERLVAAAKLAADSCNDPEKAEAIRRAIAQVEALYPLVTAAVRAVAENPSSQAAKDHLKAVTEQWEKAVANTAEAVRNAAKPENRVGQYVKAAISDLSKLPDICKRQDIAGLKSTSQSLAANIQAALDLARREMENATDPEIKALLAGKIKAVEDALQRLQAATKAAFLNPNDPQAQAELKAASEALRLRLEDLEKTVRDVRSGAASNLLSARISQLQIAADKKSFNEPQEAVVVVRGQAPKPLSEDEARKNPIKAAAQDLLIEASRWDATGNRMIQLSRSIAERLAAIADHYNQNTAASKRQLIEASRGIVSDANLVMKEMQAMMDACTDKRLKEELRRRLEIIPTLSQQLKVLTSVKAANPLDLDNDQQLITCARNLAEAVRAAIKAAEAASIRVNRPNPNMVWKRQVYKN